MAKVTLDWVADQQAKLRRAIDDLEEYCRNLPDEERMGIKKIIDRLEEILRGDEDVFGKRT